MDKSANDLGKKLTVLRLLVACIAMGMVAFAVVMQVVPGQDDPQPVKTMLIPLVAMAVAGAIGFAAARRSMISTARKKFDATAPDATALVFGQAYFTPTIIGCALAEGIGFFGIVAAYLTGEKLLLIAPGIALLVIALFFPTAGGFARTYQAATGKPLPTSDWPK